MPSYKIQSEKEVQADDEDCHPSQEAVLLTTLPNPSNRRGIDRGEVQFVVTEGGLSGNYVKRSQGLTELVYQWETFQSLKRKITNDHC